MERTRDNLGRYNQSYEAEDALEIFREREDQAKPLTANDIAERLEWSKRTVHNKLEELVERGILQTREVGARGRVWWARLDREDAPLTAMGLLNVDAPSTPEEILDLVGDEVKGKEEEQFQRAEAILYAYEFIQSEAPVSTKEIQEHTFEEYPIEEPTDRQSGRQRQWLRYLRSALQELPGIERPPRGGSAWSYLAPDSELAKLLDIEVEDWISEFEGVSGSGPVADRQRAMIQIAYDYLKHQEKARRSDFEEMLPDYTAHYTEFEGFWSYCLRKALKEAPHVTVDQQQGRYTSFEYENESEDDTRSEPTSFRE